MSPERWSKVRDILAEALERPAAERSAFVRAACEDTAMRIEVEELLASNNDDAFLEVTPREPLAPGAPKRIGPYRVLRELGHGGMGSVYLATRADDLYRKRVAIKLARGAAASDAMLGRFRHERQILAALDHPNIARLIDGGVTAEGMPYFVMEHIEGETIDVFHRNRRLKVPEILRLFATVCHAVQFAHQSLIVHRDLKPGNILVTHDGTPKLVDFGIAKFLKPELFVETLDITRTAQRPMTIAYASPEQIRGEPVTTASDVYSLGVILYELLTGRRPFDFDGKHLAEVERVICEADPPRPSAAAPAELRGRLAGDIDNIVLMALRKEPNRRYASCERFADDLRRCLEAQPVAARDNTLFYRASKFLRRNSLSSAFAAILLVGLGASMWTINVQRNRAERRFQEVRELSNTFLFEVHDAIANLSGSTQARHLIVRRALTYLDRLAGESRADPGLLGELASAYERVGMIQYRPGFAHLGDSAGALVSYQKSLDLRKEAASAMPKNLLAQRNLATTYLHVANALRAAGKSNESLEHSRKGLDLLEALAAVHPDSDRIRTDLITGYNRTGTILGAAGRVRESLELFRKATASAQALYDAHPADAAHQRNLVLAYHKLGDVLGNPNVPNVGDAAGALDYFNRALPLAEALAAGNPTNVTYQRVYLVALNRASQLQSSAGNGKLALTNSQKALELAAAIAATDRSNVQARRDHANALIRLCSIEARLGLRESALRHGAEAVAGREELAARDPKNAQFREELADGLYRFAEARQLTGDAAAARAPAERAAQIRTGLLASDPDNHFLRRTLADTHLLLAAARKAAGVSATASEKNALEALRALRKEHLRPGDAALIEKLEKN